MADFVRPTEFQDPWFPTMQQYMDDLEAKLAALTGQDSDTLQQVIDAAEIANLANTTANGKNRVYRQASMPTGGTYVTGDQWFDIDDGNKPYIWNGSAWVTAQDAAITTALNTALDAQTTADGKNKIFSQPTAPTATAVGDTWIDTANGNVIKRWDGAAWATKVFGTAAIGPDAIDATKLQDSAVTNAKILGIDAAKLTGQLDVANRIAAGAITGVKIGTDSITATNIAAGAIGASEIAANAVVAGKIAAGAVVAGTVAADAITATEIAANSITATEIVAGAITSAKIAANAVTANAIAAGTITATSGIIGSLDAGVITAGTLNAALLNVINLNASSINTGSLAATRITGNGMVLDTTSGTQAIRVNHPSSTAVAEFMAVDTGGGTSFYTIRGNVWATRSVTTGYSLIGNDTASSYTTANNAYPTLTVRGWNDINSKDLLSVQTYDQIARFVVPRRGGAVVNNNGVMSQAASAGFFSVPVITGPPTGTPDAVYLNGNGPGGGSIPIVFGTDNKMYAYSGGAWKSVLFS